MPPRPSPLQFQSFNNNTKKSLYICLTSDEYPLNYAIRSLPANMLFDNQKKQKPEAPPPPLNEVFSCSPCDYLGCAVLGSNLYIAGGGSQGKNVFGYNPATRSSFTVPDMTSPKTVPLVLAVGERLYVLSGYNRSRNIHPPIFESYTLSTKLWEQLVPPPFHNPMNTTHFDPFNTFYGCAVIGTSICVSTPKTSFKFDIEKKIWEPCMLFEGLHTVGSHSHDHDTTKKTTTPPCCGPPFGFIGQSVLFEDDILICISDIKSGVVAYKIDEGGKVVGSQSLRDQGLALPPFTESHCIADFGNGVFCLVLTKCLMDDYELHAPVLIVKPFFIKKKKKTTGLKLEEAGGDFLHCEVVNEFNYVAEKANDNESWYPICCFVQ